MVLPKKWGYILLAPPPLAAGLTTVGVFIVVGSPSVPPSSQFTNCKPAVPKSSNKQTLDLDMFLVRPLQFDFLFHGIADPPKMKIYKKGVAN